MAELKHHGILGMRWGVRRDSGSDGRVASSEHITSRKLKKQTTRSMTNAEIKQLTERLQLEKTLKQLSPSSTEKGKKFVKGVLAAGTTVASLYALSKTPLAQDVKKAISTALESEAMNIAYRRAMGG